MLKKSLKKIIATTLIAFTVALPAINVLDGQTASASSSRAEYDPYYTGGNYNPYYTENYNVIKFQNGASLENNRYEYVFKYSSRAAEKEGYFILLKGTEWAHVHETIYLEKSFPNVVNGTRTSQTSGIKH